MKRLGLFVAAAALVALGTTGTAAQGKSGAAKGAGATQAKGGNAGAPRGNSGAPQTDAPKGPSTTTAAKGPNAAETRGPKSDVRASSSSKGGGKALTANSTPTTTATTGTDTTTGTTTTAAAGTTTSVALPNRISTKIAANPQQKARIEAMLPAGMTLDEATAGFRNQGQFMAALNASKNQGVDFAALQTAMTIDGRSLGQAVKQQRNAPVTTSTTTGASGASGTTTGTTSGAATPSTSGGTTSTTPAS